MMSVNNLKVVELKALAKKCGLKTYSRFRKAELINLLRPIPTPRARSEQPIPTPRPTSERPIPAPRPRSEWPIPTPKQSGTEIVTNFIKSGKELISSLPKKIPKAFDWAKAKITNIVRKIKSAKDILVDLINRKLSELTDNKKPQPQKVDISKSVREELRDKKEEFTPVEQAFNGSYKRFRIDANPLGSDKADYNKFFLKLKPILASLIKQQSEKLGSAKIQTTA